MRLNELRENPNNPSKCSEEDLERLAGKLKRVPLGLTAMRIAYVTDDPEGGKMVISGNKRLRVLKRAYGEDAELPDDYFQDVTAMSEAERHEFIVAANVSDGEWDLDMLLQQYEYSELTELMDKEALDDLLSMREEELGGEDGKYEQPQDTIYTKKVDGLIYEPTGECPQLGQLVDVGKTKELIERIEASDIPEDIKQFLMEAAHRHSVFNYSLIAEYYAHAPAEVQRLMEDSALVIIDFDKAIEQGLVRYSKKLEDLRGGLKDADTVEFQNA